MIILFRIIKYQKLYPNKRRQLYTRKNNRWW